MILVDIGNSGLRATRVEDGKCFSRERVFRLSWVAASAPHRKPSPEQLSDPDQRWCGLDDRQAFEWLLDHFSQFPNERWRISSVQRVAIEQLQRCLADRIDMKWIQTIQQSDIPIPNSVLEPQKTGLDRLLAAWGGFHWAREKRIPLPLIIVQAGTAVTVDWIDAQGTFCGGAIMPGLGLSLQFLAAGTDLLPWLSNHVVNTMPDIPGRNTTQAIAAGVHAALVGGTIYLIDRYRKSCFTPHATHVLVTGGDGKLLMPHVTGHATMVEHLVLRGLSVLDVNPTAG
jgi:type III pantothenate kinase